MNFRLVIFVALLFVIGCDSGRNPPDTGHVYTSALSELAPSISHFTIQASKVGFGAGNIAPDMKKFNEYGTFRFADSRLPLVEGNFPSLNVTLLSDGDLEEISSVDCETYWGNFRTNYPEATGLLKFSEVGFSDNGEEAILYLEGVSGCTVGRGMIVLLGWEVDHWVVVESHELWVS